MTRFSLPSRRSGTEAARARVGRTTRPRGDLDLVRCGANGVICVDCIREEFVRAVDAIMDGRCYISLAALEELRTQPRRSTSRRTRQVLELVCAGVPLGDIAERLGVTTRTVTSHMNRGLRMEVAGSDDLVARTRLALRTPPAK